MLKSWNDFGISIFSKMAEEATKNDAISLAQGFPDFDPPPEIIEEAVNALRGGFNQYAPSKGYLDLRVAIADYVEQRRQQKYDPDAEISVFSGATEALFCAVIALCEKGDELLTFEPFYDIYPGFALAAGARYVSVKLDTPDWGFDAEELRLAISNKTRVILLNTPNNPSGKVFSRAELELIAELAIRHDLIVVTDEVYEEIVFEPNQHLSIAQLPGMKERTVVVSSASKTFSVTGWKIGYALGPAKFINRMRTIHEHTVFCSASPLQKAVTKAFQLPSQYFEDLRRDYAQKRTFLLETLKKAQFKCLVPQGSYFVVADYSAISELDDEDFAVWLTREIKVASIPMSAFYSDKESMKKRRLVRFCFAKKPETLQESARRLAQI
jgi:N-succinyldiaminopimelate aminotransferase